MKRVCMIGLLFCLLLTGCGGEGSVNLQQSGDVSIRQSEDIPAGTEQTPVTEQTTGTEQSSVTEPPAVTEQSPVAERPAGEARQILTSLHVKKTETVQFAEPEEGYWEHNVSYKILGKKIYMLRIESTEGKYASRLCVQIYDTESGEMQQLRIVPQISEHEGSSILSADLTAGMELSLKMQDTEAETPAFLVRMNLEGEVLTVTDPFPEESSYPWNRDPLAWDVAKVYDLSDGRTVLGRSNAEEETTRLTWFREDTGSEEPLGTVDSGYVRSLMLDEEGLFYYMSVSSLIRWDPLKNISEDLFRLHENGISTTAQEIGLIRNEEGEFLFCYIKSGKAIIFVLTDQESSDEKIRLCSLMGSAGTGYFHPMAATFNQNGGGIPIHMELEGRYEYMEGYRNRIMAEMVAGEGPDILYVSRDDMILMQEKGMLCDLSDMIDQETKEVMIPGVLELGTVNGELVGLVPEVSFEVLGTSNKLWTGNSWNVKELISVLEAADNLEYPVVEYWVWASGEGILNGVFLKDLAKSGFLDFEQGKAHFDCEEFTDILELCKKYGDQRPSEEKWKESMSVDKCTKLLREGEIAVDIQYFYQGIHSYSSLAASYGDEGHIVGFPVESGSGCYVNSYSYGYLVVNAQAEHKEEISKYFDWLLNYDNQFKTSGGCVRMDVIRDSVYKRWDDSYVKLCSSDLDNIDGYMIDSKPDGTSYLEEYLDFVENCEPTPYWPEQIKTIIDEEIAPFFDGKKSAAEVAAIIQNRVQLYLDETR